MTNRKHESLDELTFEECLEQLQQVIATLEDGSTGLSAALTEYEKGVRFLKQCHHLLERAEEQVLLLSGFDAEGNPVTAPFEETPMSLEEKASKRSRRRTAKNKTSSNEPASSDGDVDDSTSLF